MKKKIVYIAHPVGGDVKGNMIKIGEIFRALSLKNEVIPFAPYIADLSCLDDNIPQERAIGFEHNKAMFARGVVDELWWFGHISNGVAQEIEWCKQFGITVREGKV